MLGFCAVATVVLPSSPRGRRRRRGRGWGVRWWTASNSTRCYELCRCTNSSDYCGTGRCVSQCFGVGVGFASTEEGGNVCLVSVVAASQSLVVVVVIIVVHHTSLWISNASRWGGGCPCHLHPLCYGITSQYLNGEFDRGDDGVYYLVSDV